MVKVGQTHRRHDAGEARDGGAMRKRATGHGRGRAWARWRALAPARRTVVVAVPEVAGTDDGDDSGGCRSSVELGVEATTAAGMRGWHLRLLRGAVRTWVCSVGRYGDCGHDSDDARRRRASELKGAAATECWGRRGKGESGQWLTAELQGWLAGSGTSGSSRFDGDDLRWPRRGTATWAAMQGFRRPVDRWGGRGGRGGAPELVGGARGGR